MRRALITGLLTVALAVAAGNATAQRADCPKDILVSNPLLPPGPPPTVEPEFDFPASPDTPSRPPRFPPPGPPKYDLLETEEGYLAEMVRSARSPSAPAPSAEALRQLVPVSDTKLATWQFVKHERTHFRVQQISLFSKNGSLLRFQQYREFPDQGAAFPLNQANARIGDIPAWEAGLRSPSGCVLATLSWKAGDLHFSLSTSGPLDWAAQKALLMDIASSIEAARKRVPG